MLQSIRRLVRKSDLLRRLAGYHLASHWLMDSYFKNYHLDGPWKARVDDVLASSDLAKIEKVADAGKIAGGKQIMHNGLKIYNGSYYGPEYAQLLCTCQGVHEPQEEFVFQEVLKSLKPGALMIEMGAFWSFYSMWFQQKIPNAKNFMIEPEAFNLGHGKRNFKLNGMTGSFTHAFIGMQSSEGCPATVCIDDFVKTNKIDFVDLLHSDIQGFEHDMLLGAETLFASKRVGYVFISTHNDQVHQSCLDYLLQHDFIVIAAANMAETFSVDGLIVARAPYYPGIGPLQISKKVSSDSRA
ncbi:MAG: FkbM family methyltransferase [Pirellulales bacterium]